MKPNYPTEVIVASAIQDSVIVNGEGNQTIESIARACHSANGSYSDMIGDGMQQPWAAVADSVMSGVKFRLANPLSTPADSHANWMIDKHVAGWTYGPVKDAEKKEHPCFVPYAELPASQRAKDHIFVAVVDGLKAQLRRDVFANAPDERQSVQPVLAEEHKLFRKRYRQLSPEDVALHDQIKDKADELAALFYKVSPIHAGPDSNRERGANVTLAVRHLEDAVYRAVKGLTS
jgi:hypothetical protein